jgi:exodeoxyribonuclease V beta subunit
MVRAPRPATLPPPDAQLVVVEASAGTGKTFFLEHRVVDLILAGAELGQILLVTFTDKAVAELRQRIRDLLDRLARASTDLTAGEPCWTIDDAARQRLRAAVMAFDQAQIFTIHGFCHRILIEDAFAARRLFEQTQIADEVAFDAAFIALLREKFARLAPERDLLAAFLETGRTVDRLRAILLGCVRAGTTRVRRRLDADAARAAVAGLARELGSEAQRARVIATLPKNGNDRRWITDWLAKIAATLANVELDAPAARLLGWLDEIREPLSNVLSRAAVSTPHVALEAALRAALATVTLDEAIAAALLPAVIERVERDKSERGQFDYDDMLQLVWRALCGPRQDELAARLRARTPWAMIDEFQDTDPVQWQIFRQVWLCSEARGLTIVGDPKQAIYGFRGADVHTYLAARDEMLRAGATRVALDVNRRSTDRLVAAVNQILTVPFAPLLQGEITYDAPVRASGDIVCGDVRPPVAVFAFAAKGTKDAVRVAHARAIGEAIEQLRAAPPSWARRGEVQPFRLGDVMVLTRTNKDSAEVAAALRARGLPCALVEPDRLFHTREAAELASVLAAIAAPRDRSARLRALRTRFFDVPWAELAQVVDAPDHHPLIARIFDWAQLAARRAYETLFRRLVEDSRYAERALVLGGGERALTNTWHLIELLLAEVARSRCDLHELVVQLRRWMADDVVHTDERDVQRAETDGDAIRVLTVHKAKGLEAPYVFLFGGIASAPRGDVQTLRDAAGRALVVGKPDDETTKRLDEEVEAEHQRLAYVALTRAQVRLYLPLYEANQVKERSAYHPIQRCLVPQLGRTNGSVAPTLFERIDVALGAEEPPAPPPDALATFVAPPPPPTVELLPLPPSRAGLAMLSYTRLARAHAPTPAPTTAAAPVSREIDPAEFDIDDDAPPSSAAVTSPALDPADLPPGASSGLLLHDVLENADLALARRTVTDPAAWASDPTVAAQLADAARARGVPPICLPRAAALVHATLTTPLALVDGTELPPLVTATALAREVEFAYPLPPNTLGARGLVKGYIDALALYDDALWVVDYKSDVLPEAQRVAAAQERVRDHYAIQAKLYALAAERLCQPTASRTPRRFAGLLFVFVRYGIAVPMQVDPDALERWTDWLAALASGEGELTA